MTGWLNLKTVLRFFASWKFLLSNSLHQLSIQSILYRELLCFFFPGATGVIHDVPLKSIKDLCRVTQDILGHIRARVVPPCRTSAWGTDFETGGSCWLCHMWFRHIWMQKNERIHVLWFSRFVDHVFLLLWRCVAAASHFPWSLLGCLSHFPLTSFQLVDLMKLTVHELQSRACGNFKQAKHQESVQRSDWNSDVLHQDTQWLTPWELVFNGNNFPSFLLFVGSWGPGKSIQTRYTPVDLATNSGPDVTCRCWNQTASVPALRSKAKDDMCATLVLRNNEWAGLRNRSTAVSIEGTLRHTETIWQGLTRFPANFAICGGCSRVLQCIVLTKRHFSISACPSQHGKFPSNMNRTHTESKRCKNRDSKLCTWTFAVGKVGTPFCAPVNWPRCDLSPKQHTRTWWVHQMRGAT